MPGVFTEKTKWILAQPIDEPAPSVAKRATDAGFETTTNQVHQARYQERLRKKADKKARPKKEAPAKKKLGRPKGATRVRVEGPRNEAERDFAQSAVAIGVPRALEIIEAIQLHWGSFMQGR